MLTDSILNVHITDMRPLSMVEDKGFLNMINAFNPKYTVPSKNTLHQFDGEKIHVHNREIEECSEGNRVCVLH